MAIDFSAISAASQVTPDTTKNTKASSNPEAGSQDYFLKLLVAQMNNQDPLNPLDSAQMTSQLAQLNTVTGINNLATKLDSLLGAQNTAQGLQATALVGHGVLGEGNKLSLVDGKAVAGVELASGVDSLTVVVKDSTGKVIHTQDLGKQDAGVVEFGWDGSTDGGGTAKAGDYTFSVEGKLAGKTVKSTPLSTGLVTGVSPSANGTALMVNGVGSMTMNQIRQIY